MDTGKRRREFFKGVDSLKNSLEAEFMASRFRASLDGDIFMQKAPNREFVRIGEMKDPKDAEVIANTLNQVLKIIDKVEELDDNLNYRFKNGK